MTKATYNEDSIKSLDWKEHIRLRPGMYIGDTTSRGLHHLVWEIVDNSVDEALAGFCSEITIKLHADDSITVIDNGRGVPTGMHPSGLTGVEVVFTKLHAFALFAKFLSNRNRNTRVLSKLWVMSCSVHKTLLFCANRGHFAAPS